MTVAGRTNAVLRAGILRAADDRHVRGFMGRYGMRLGAARFVAGENLDECVAVLRRLADQGLHTNTTLLGESVRDRGEAEAVASEYGRVLERLDAASGSSKGVPNWLSTHPSPGDRVQKVMAFIESNPMPVGTTGRTTGTPSTSACSCMRVSLTVAPPSTFSTASRTPESFTIASSTARVWKQIASSVARARCAFVLNRESPTIAPRASERQYGANNPENAGTK